MRRLFLVAILFTFGIAASQAQEVRLGVKGGVNFSNFTGDGYSFEGVTFDQDTKGRTSFHLGAFAEIPVTEKFWVQPEVLYSGQGYDIESNEDADDVEFQLDYINVPVMAKYYIINGLYVEAGPQIGFNVKSEIDSDPDDEGSGDTPLNEDAFNDIDFGAGIGAGYRFNTGLFLNARYTQGFSDVFNNEDLIGEFDAKNSVFALSVGYSF